MTQPVQVLLELPASLHRDFVPYVEASKREDWAACCRHVGIILPRLKRSIARHRGFAKARRLRQSLASNLWNFGLPEMQSGPWTVGS